MTNIFDADSVINTEAAIKDMVTPDIYERFREAIAIGRWPNGVPLTPEQRATCINAIIVYEADFPPEERTGYVPSKACASKNDNEQTHNENHLNTDKPIKWAE